MKFVTATHHNGNPFVGLVYKENIIDLQQLDEVYNGGPSQISNTLIECIEHGDAFLKKVNELLNSC